MTSWLCFGVGNLRAVVPADRGAIIAGLGGDFGGIPRADHVGRARELMPEPQISVDGQIMAESEFRRWLGSGGVGPRRILSCECGRQTCPRARTHVHYRLLSMVSPDGVFRPCQSPGEFCAEMLGGYLRPIGTVELTIARALDQFANDRSDVSPEQFESLLAARSANLRQPVDEGEDVGAMAASYVLGKWMQFRGRCEDARRALEHSAMPGWALYAFQHGGVCEHFVDDPRRFYLALTRLVPRYTLAAGISEDAWRQALAAVTGAASTSELWTTTSQHRKALDPVAVEHLHASWIAYQRAWETHVCGRHQPCGRLPPDQEPYCAIDAYWETLGEISKQS